MNCNPIPQKPVYSEELFQSFYPAICKIMAKTVLKLPQDSTNIDRFEDYVQYCRMLLHEQCELYDPERIGRNGRKCKFSTYMIMVFHHRLLTKYNNIMIKRRRHICTDYSNLFNSKTYNEESQNHYYEDDISYLVQGNPKNNSAEFQYALKEHYVSLKNLIPAKNFGIYEDYFINGHKNFEELSKKHSEFEYNQIRSIVIKLRKINKIATKNLKEVLY